VRQALAGKPLTVYGDGTQTRCFCHVADVIRALAGLLDRPDAVGEVFNVGSNDEISIYELARRIVDMTGSISAIELIPYDRAYEAGFEDMYRRVPDTGKLFRLTGWTPKHDLDEILRDSIDEAALEQAPQVPAIA
jgi:UDP-glucose 4-epimerase